MDIVERQFSKLFVENLTFMEKVTYKFPKARPITKKKKKNEAKIC
jgi:hypothetical protein